MFFIGGVASTTSQTLDAQDLMIRRDGTESGKIGHRRGILAKTGGDVPREAFNRGMIRCFV